MNPSCRATIARALAIALVVLVAPIAYAQQELPGPDTVSFTSDSLTLRGIIYRPDGNGPFPTILFNHGSGQSYTKEVEAVGRAYAGHGFVFFAPSRRGQWLLVWLARSASTDFKQLASRAGYRPHPFGRETLPNPPLFVTKRVGPGGPPQAG